MKREKLREIARQAMEEIAQEARFRPEDHQVLLKHKDRLLAPTFAKVPLRA
jgi:molybdopterin synthase catalytic subunit